MNEQTSSLLDARLRVTRGRFVLDAALTAPAGGIAALVGPNGAGKSTVLRALAGLTRLEAGHVRLGERVLADAARRVHVAPQTRDVGMVFQDYRLFPRMSVLANVAFGLRARGVSRREAHERARDWLDRVGLTAQADVRPETLSGGQAQRVALARALAFEPALLLLDEPFAALDAEARLSLRDDLATHLAGFPGATLLVTHDPGDAIALADRMVVLEDGRVTQTGTTDEVINRPRSAFVARLAGTNLLSGAVRDGVASFGAIRAAVRMPDGPVLGSILPRRIGLEPGRGHRVVSIAVHPGFYRIRLTGEPDLLVDLPSESAATLGLAVGGEVAARIDEDAIVVYPSQEPS